MPPQSTLICHLFDWIGSPLQPLESKRYCHRVWCGTWHRASMVWLIKPSYTWNWNLLTKICYLDAEPYPSTILLCFCYTWYSIRFGISNVNKLSIMHTNSVLIWYNAIGAHLRTSITNLASNILFEDNIRAKVADFGLVQLESKGNQSTETWLLRTFGYLTREYAGMLSLYCLFISYFAW